MMTTPRTFLILLTACGITLAGDPKSPAGAGSDWEFSLSAGPAWRQSGNLGFAGGSRSGSTFIPSFVGGNRHVDPIIGEDDAFGDRLYNDGFVRPDASTSIDGFTTFWGYEGAGQVNGDELSFHATGYRSIRTDDMRTGVAPAGNRHEQGVAPFIEFDATYREIGGIRPGFSASLSWVPIKLNRQWSDFSLLQTRDDYRHDWTDTYNLGGFGGFVPSAPYAGTFAGPGFVLENIPDLREFESVLINTDTAHLSNSISTRFRADHSTLSFGPTLEREIAESWNVGAGIGVSLHWLHWSARQDETLTATNAAGRTVVADWSDRSSGNTILGGLYLQIGTEWTPRSQDWSIKTLLRTELGQKFSRQLGPSRVTYEVDGLTAAVLFSHKL